MASNQDIGEELECPICKDYFKVPKVMGTCLHVACLECLQQLVASRRTDFPCPVCRQKCWIPTQGVAALRDDFRIRAIVEKYQQLKKEKNFIHCSACPNPASHFCKECGKIYLCIACSRKHSRNPLTNAHELVGVCSKHGKSLTMYCRKCNAAICSVCLIADHAGSGQDHDVDSHQKVADEKVAEVSTAVDELEKAKRRKKNALRKILRIRDSVTATIDSDLGLLGKQSNSVMDRSSKTHAGLIAEKGSIQKQIEALIVREKAIDEEINATEKKIEADWQKKEEYADFIKSYRGACMEKINEAAAKTIAETGDIRANLELGRRGKSSTKDVLDDQTVPALLKIKEGLIKTLTTAEQVDRDAKFVDEEESMPRFVPASGDMEIGFIRRDHALKRVADIFFPAHRPCKSVGSLKHLPDGRLACLYQTEKNEHKRSQGDTILLHDPASPAVSPVVIHRNIGTPVAMTVTSKGEPMVLNDSLVKILINDGGSRGIIHINKIYPSEYVSSIECDEEDNIIVSFSTETVWAFSLKPGGSNLRVFNPDGILINQISEGRRHDVHAMSYCRLKRVIYILAARNIILRYHWDGTTLKKMQSSELPCVNGFEFDDVCIDNFGAVFVAGQDLHSTIHIYQVIQAEPPIRQTEDAASSTHFEELDDSDDESSEDEGIKCTMIELSFEDSARGLANTRRWSEKKPVISISGDTLALGYDNKLELFHLIRICNTDNNECSMK